MSMTKKERAKIELLLTEAALRRTSPVSPDVAPPSSTCDGLTAGFTYIAPLSEFGRVEEGCSSSTTHGIGRTDRTGSKRPIWLYSTRLLALKALRYEIESYCCNKLRRIDRMIEEQMDKDAAQ